MPFLSIITEILLIGGEYSQLTIVLVYYIPFKGLHSQLQCNTSRKIMRCCMFLLDLFSSSWLWFCILALNQNLQKWFSVFALSCHFCTMRMGAFCPISQTQSIPISTPRLKSRPRAMHLAIQQEIPFLTLMHQCCSQYHHSILNLPF